VPVSWLGTWLGTWLMRNPSWNWQTLTYPEFDKLFAQSVRESSGVIATGNPDLSVFETDSRPICLYPKFARYIGHGRTTKARNYVCR
jgi:hypothetical protein